MYCPYKWWQTLINKSKYPLDSVSDIGVYLKIRTQTPSQVNLHQTLTISMKLQQSKALSGNCFHHILTNKIKNKEELKYFRLFIGVGLVTSDIKYKKWENGGYMDSFCTSDSCYQMIILCGGKTIGEKYILPFCSVFNNTIIFCWLFSIFFHHNFSRILNWPSQDHTLCLQQKL